MLAILITILVLELKVPVGGDAAALRPLLPVFLTYLLSFIYLAIYWNNHHHMLNTVTRVSAGMLWSNLHLLFWLSLIPFVTGWMGQNHFAATPTALYRGGPPHGGGGLLVLQRTILRSQGPRSGLAGAIGRDLKGKLSPVLYALAIPCAFASRWVAWGLYVLVALIWLVPDRRIERLFQEAEGN